MGELQRFDITPAWWVAKAAHCGVAAMALVGLPAFAQLDGTLEDIIDQQIIEEVESDLVESIEQSIEQAVEQQIEAGVAESIEQQIEAGVTESIEQQIDASVTESLEQAIEAGLTESVEQQIEAGVADSIEQQLDSNVSGVIERQLESGLSETVEKQLGTAIEQMLEGDLGALLDPILEDNGELAEPLEQLPELLDDALDRERSAAGQSEPTPTSEQGGAAVAETFVADLDGNGRAIERDVWVILVPPEHAARIDGWGFDVREQRQLDALDRVLLRVSAPEDRDIAQAALELALDAPGTLVDLNHVYRVNVDDTDQAGGRHTGLVSSRALETSTEAPFKPAPASRATLAIGMVDSAVFTEHEAFASADVVQKDFVPFVGSRPTEHGTAVGSILIGGDSAPLQSQLAGTRLYAASVFFHDEAGNEAATTASLVDALDWLVAQEVGVINMSLAGPANVVLEAAIAETARRGVIVVAAVGNNGPAGEPLYPAAYETVVGVTAVDSTNRIYRYANRGRHVAFAAPGVDVTAAQSQGGFGKETGTSMAAPHAAAIIALSASRGHSAEHVLAKLKAAAIDLGDKDIDDVFGFGLIAAVE